MRWVNEAKSRYYETHLVQDLFGEWMLITVWGGLGSRRGGMRSTVVPSYEDGLVKMGEIAKRRQQRGYERIDTH